MLVKELTALKDLWICLL